MFKKCPACGGDLNSDESCPRCSQESALEEEVRLREQLRKNPVAHPADDAHISNRPEEE